MPDNPQSIYLATAKLIINDAEEDSRSELTHKLYHKYYDRSQTMDFDLSQLDKEIKTLTFQPMSQHCIVDVELLAATRNNGDYVTLSFTTNGEWNNQNCILFASIEPKMFLTSPVDWSELKTLSIRINYRVTDIKTLKFLFGYMLLSDKISIVSDEPNPAELDVELLKNSVSYKLGFALTAPARWLYNSLFTKSKNK